MQEAPNTMTEPEQNITESRHLNEVNHVASTLVSSEPHGGADIKSSHILHQKVVLIPTPSGDPDDPLNWTQTRKYVILAVLSVATFSEFTGALAGQLEVAPLSKSYHVETSEVAYQNSAANTGMIIGSLIFYPLSHVIGRPSAIFWSMIGVTLSQIWAALMTKSDNYDAYIISRGFAGFFGTIVGVLGPRILIDLFFLHQRGRVYTIFYFWMDVGNAVGPSICAFIASASNWTWAFWWVAILCGVSVLSIWCFLPDTTWDRREGAINRKPKRSWLRERVETFLPGTNVTSKKPPVEIVRPAVVPFRVALTPVTILTSLFCLLNFGFYVGMNSVAPVWLQRPVKSGGYGFTANQNALFQFFHWVGIAMALLYGQLVSDHLPLALAGRFNNGNWKPEYRLHALWLPALICNPIGLGIFGYALQNQLPWGLLRFSHILVTFGSLCVTPITVNYLSECFTNNIEETAIVLNAFRVGFGLSLVFYINPWVAKVGFAWAYGTMAFIQVFSWLFLTVLMFRGYQIRQLNPFGLVSTEEGEHVLDKEKSVACRIDNS
ncbi:major facilitator superfamily domain-containing protein [Truncatella angustata]|uniref:Major facilitator superfamily domain-containing protein n=1 Tax=Truncatella angustata TaxID=152316 RepID=A0A9P8UZX4_9PEZI|nr:major facilitator superfamily domain-containing protein [Truncatella angustata]KAH6661282.1 major facilitator superfamily domain-containing protein [Truncatella angustata]